MLNVIKGSWALFFGLGLIMLAHGLQGSLLGVRASLEGFNITIIGFIMSGYYVGLLTGALIAPKIIGRVGHVRTFGALASLASTSILVHVVFVDPIVWMVMRVVTGFSLAGIYIVTESWLNEKAENDTRGQLLSFYMLISLGGLAGGQIMLNIASPSESELFILVSVLISLAVIPILVSVSRAPGFGESESVSIRQLYQVSPLGVVGSVIVGLVQGAMFGMGATYATRIGLEIREVSIFMASMILGGFLLQYPLGRLSDIIGRRRVIIGTCIAGAMMSFVLANSASFDISTGARLFAATTVFGGLTMPLYALCIAHTNDYLNPSQMVAASGTLMLTNSIGAVMGPSVAAISMDMFGSQAFYLTIGLALTMVAVFAVWRSTRRVGGKPEETQGEFVVMTPTSSAAMFNPDLALEEIEAATDVDAQAVQESFEELAAELAEDSEEES